MTDVNNKRRREYWAKVTDATSNLMGIKKNELQNEQRQNFKSLNNRRPKHWRKNEQRCKTGCLNDREPRHLRHNEQR